MLESEPFRAEDRHWSAWAACVGRGSRTCRASRGGWVAALRRALTWRNVAAALLIAISLSVVMAALSGPPSRATVFRTDPVLRAMGVPEDEPEGEFAALAAVPSLSASPRFVLPLVRDEGKRLLAALPPPVAVPEPAPRP